MKTGTMIEQIINYSVINNFKVNLNDTVDTDDDGINAKIQIYKYVIPLLGTFIILINLAVVISSGLILKKGQEPRSTYLFLGNVAMSDLVTAIAVVFGDTFPKAKRNKHICAIQLGMIVSCTITSVYSVGLIAVDRFLYILHGMQYQTWVYPNRARILIALSWTIGGVIGFLPLMGWSGDTENGQICWFILVAPKNLILLTVLVGVVPLIIVTVLYAVILYQAIRKIMQLKTKNDKSTDESVEDISSGNIRMFRGRSKQSEATNEANTENEPKALCKIFRTKPTFSVKKPRKWKAIKVVLFTTGSFLVTWSPYFITSVVYVLNCDFNTTAANCKYMRELIASPLAILGFMNSLLNPIIYAWWHNGFRNFVKKKCNAIIMRRNKKIGAIESRPKANSSSTTSFSNEKFHRDVSTSQSSLDTTF